MLILLKITINNNIIIVIINITNIIINIIISCPREDAAAREDRERALPRVGRRTPTHSKLSFPV